LTKSATHEVGLDISHNTMKEVTDTSLLEVASSSETAHTLVTCDHLDSVRTLYHRHLTSTQEHLQDSHITQTT